MKILTPIIDLIGVFLTFISIVAVFENSC